MYSKMAEISLKLDKADFAVNGYEVDKRKYPRQGPKEPSTSRRTTMIADDAFMIDLSEEESDSSNSNAEIVQLGQEGIGNQLLSLESSDKEEEEAESQGHSVPLQGSRLGVVDVDDDENEDLARARLQATPRKLFVSTSQPSPSERRPESRPSFSTPLPPPNQPSPRKSRHIAESVDRHRPSAADDPEMPQLLASQASVSESTNPPVNMAQMLMNFMQQMQQNQQASDTRNMEIMEVHQLETESKLEQQRRDMDLCLEQQRKDMATIAEKIVENVVNQVPLIVQNASIVLGSVLNVAPLQLKGPSSS